ncbi:MAG: PorT family protein [Saprospiraceae bacterium]|nr:PorT family protein [Saprospiraceae bacterium]
MKNTIIKFSLLPYLILFVNTLYISAQENTASFHLGIKAGVNFANVYDEQGEDFQADGKIGFAGGAFMTIPISTWLGVQPEILFSQKGFKATGTLLNNPYTLTRTYNHFDVPIYLAIMPIKSLTLLVGPQFSFLTRQRMC